MQKSCSAELIRKDRVRCKSSITKIMKIILVEDAWPDESWKVLSNNLAPLTPNAKTKAFPANFWAALTRISCRLGSGQGWFGCSHGTCDLQDRPEEIPALFHKAQEGFEVVFWLEEPSARSFFQATFSSKAFPLPNIKAWFDDHIKWEPSANFGHLYSKKSFREINRHAWEYPLFSDDGSLGWGSNRPH